ncbi:MAG: hypothetical protein R3F49_19960 [Planctomycetota bacterium]
MNAAHSKSSSSLSRRVLSTGVLALACGAPALANGGVYLESNGLVVINFESRPTVGDWAFSNTTPNYSGDGYIRWDGPDLFGSPGTGGLFSYDIEISTPGTYTLNLRNRHEDPNPTEDNDVWIQLDGGVWEKVFSNGAASVGNWTWESRVELPNFTYPQQSYVLSAGVHTLAFSGRSNGFKMDRFHLALPGHPSEFDPGAPESECRIGTVYGVANPNSTGSIGQVEAFGSTLVARNDVTLHGSQLPQGSLGFFIVSNTQMFFAHPGGSTGNVLVGPTVGRYGGNVLFTNAQGRVSMSPSLTAIPRPSGPVATMPGDTWNFQFWHRDTNGGSPTSNFTRAVSITFE